MASSHRLEQLKLSVHQLQALCMNCHHRVLQDFGNLHSLVRQNGKQSQQALSASLTLDEANCEALHQRVPRLVIDDDDGLRGRQEALR